MSRRNSLRKRRAHHDAMLKEERARATAARIRVRRRIARRERNEADIELAGALVLLNIL